MRTEFRNRSFLIKRLLRGKLPHGKVADINVSFKRVEIGNIFRVIRTNDLTKNMCQIGIKGTLMQI